MNSNESAIEGSGQNHVVTRRPVPADELYRSNENVDLGEVSTEETFVELTNLAATLVGKFLEGKEELINIDEQLLKDLAEFVISRFAFKYNSLGMATVAKQLESYRTVPVTELSEKLDCKLATVMMGLMTEKIAKILQIEAKTFLGSSRSSIEPHPHLVIEVHGVDNQVTNFLADAHVQEKLPPDDLVFESRRDKRRWIRDNSPSVLVVRSYDGQYGRARVVAEGKEFVTELTSASVASMDQAFLSA